MSIRLERLSPHSWEIPLCAAWSPHFCRGCRTATVQASRVARLGPLGVIKG